MAFEYAQLHLNYIKVIIKEWFQAFRNNVESLEIMGIILFYIVGVLVYSMTEKWSIVTSVYFITISSKYNIAKYLI